jgi:hypothetical protein
VTFDVSSECMFGHRKTRRFAEDQIQRKPLKSTGPAGRPSLALRFGHPAIKMTGYFQ